MDPKTPAKLIEANRSDNGVIIGFADGRTAFYSAELLYKTLPLAQEIVDTEDDE